MPWPTDLNAAWTQQQITQLWALLNERMDVSGAPPHITNAKWAVALRRDTNKDVRALLDSPVPDLRPSGQAGTENKRAANYNSALFGAINVFKVSNQQRVEVEGKPTRTMDEGGGPVEGSDESINGITEGKLRKFYSAERSPIVVNTQTMPGDEFSVTESLFT